MRRVLTLVGILLLTACGGAPPTPTVEPTPTIAPTATVNAAATATRGAELAQFATLTAPSATPLPTPEPTVVHTAFMLGAIVFVLNAFSIQIVQVTGRDYPTTPPAREIQIAVRITNIGKSDMRYTACSFILRDGSGEDNEAKACNDRAYPQGPFLITPGGSRPETVVLGYFINRDATFVRFAPETPSGTAAYFDIIPGSISLH